VYNGVDDDDDDKDDDKEAEADADAVAAAAVFAEFDEFVEEFTVRRGASKSSTTLLPNLGVPGLDMLCMSMKCNFALNEGRTMTHPTVDDVFQFFVTKKWKPLSGGEKSHQNDDKKHT